jgi:predicted RNA-binding protein with PIN domain
VTRGTARQAEADLLARPVASAASPVPSSGPAPSAPAPAPGSDGSPRAARGPAAARTAVAAAADAAAELARALAEAATALGSGAEDDGDAAGGGGRVARAGAGASPSPSPSPSPSGSGRRRARARGGPRARSALPPGIVAGSPEADRHLVRSPDVLVVVDGYNLARTAWSGLDPEEERRRTITLLEEVAARSGARHEIVFDGDDHAVAPTASRAVGVRFSATGVTADHAISVLLATLPATRTVVVVSSDRAVADDARRQRAHVMASAAFLTAVGR